MTVKEARNIVQGFDESRVYSEDEEFMFIMAMEYLIKEKKDPRDMMYLGGYYYEKKNFDMALDYYEMAAAQEHEAAFECLGYIWYYGRTGKKDYKKAFKYFSYLMDKGNPVAAYKVADMYKNGYYVEQDYEKYKSIIEDLYERVQNFDDAFDPVPEILTRLAGIRKEEGDLEEAVKLYLVAKLWLARRIQFNAFFGNLNIMKWLIDDLYEIVEFDEMWFDFYDLYYLLKTPHEIRFFYKDEEMTVVSELVNDQCAVCFNDKWFLNRDDFFNNATTADGKKLTAVYEELYGFQCGEYLF